MVIKPICDRCKKELDDYGALLFSPPDKTNTVTKFHICKDCFIQLKIDFNQNAK